MPLQDPIRARFAAYWTASSNGARTYANAPTIPTKVVQRTATAPSKA